MSLTVTLLILAAAAMHAAWNTIVKASRDVMLDTALVAGGASVVGAALLPFADAPLPASWPFIGMSVVLHLGYYTALVGAYRNGDLSHAYPLMRGMPPLLVALVGTFLLGERPSATMWAGIVLICTGVLVLGGFQRLFASANARSTAFALGNAIIIAAYTVVDGAGVRAAGTAAGYALWLFFLEGIPFTLGVLWIRRRHVAAHVRRHWWRGLLGGAFTVAAYGIVLWAMTRAPVAAVAALRETSVIFVAFIGALLLKEPFGRRRVAGACLVATGVALLRA